MTDRIKAILESILERFKSGDIPKAIAYAMFPIPSIPSASWSLLNKLTMLFGGTEDAWDQEIVEQLTGQTLCFLAGKDGRNMLGNSYAYIEGYAAKAGLNPIVACLKVVNDVEKVLNLILSPVNAVNSA